MYSRYQGRGGQTHEMRCAVRRNGEPGVGVSWRRAGASRKLALPRFGEDGDGIIIIQATIVEHTCGRMVEVKMAFWSMLLYVLGPD